MNINALHQQWADWEHAYKQALAHYKHDDALNALALLQGNKLPEAVQMREKIESQLEYAKTEESYLAKYEEQAGDTAPGSHVGLWRADWIVDRVAAFARRGVVTRVLDIGCSYGEMTVRFANEIPELTIVKGVDISPAFLEIAKQHPVQKTALEKLHGNTSPEAEVARAMIQAGTAKLVYEVQNAEHLLESDDSYDVTILSGIIEHVRDDKAALSEAKRVTRPNGYIFLSVPRGGMGFYASPGSDYLLHVREWNPYFELQGEHVEIEYYDQTLDPHIWFAQRAAADGQPMGEYCVCWINKKGPFMVVQYPEGVVPKL